MMKGESKLIQSEQLGVMYSGEKWGDHYMYRWSCLDRYLTVFASHSLSQNWIQ